MRQVNLSSIICATARCIALSIVCTASLCCLKQELHETAGTPEPGAKTDVRIRVRAADAPWKGCETRSSLVFPEDRIGNMVIGAYLDGHLFRQAHFEEAEECRLELLAGKRFRIYALANMPPEKEAVMLPIEEEELKDFRLGGYSLREYSGFPMAGIAETGGGKDEEVTIVLERLVAKIDFAIDKSAFETMRVTGVRFRNAPEDIAPFAAESKAASADAGDYAADMDLTALNAGETASFYMFENCRGVLLPDNTEQKGKVPEKIAGAGDNPDLCTYIEVTCESMDFGITSRMTYRMYLGGNTVSDFSIRRNTWHRVTLVSSYDGLQELSWRITPVVEPSGEIATPAPTDIAGQMIASHSKDLYDIYIGEFVSYGFSIDSRLATLLELGSGQTVGSMQLKYYENGAVADNILRFEAIAAGTDATEGVENPISYRTEAHATAFSVPAGGEIWLCGSDGRKIIKVSNAKVRKPALKLKTEVASEPNLFYIKASEGTEYSFHDARGNMIPTGPRFDHSIFCLETKFQNDILNGIYNPELIFSRETAEQYETPRITFDYSLKEAGRKYAPGSAESEAIIGFHYRGTLADRKFKIYEQNGLFNEITVTLAPESIFEDGAEHSYYSGKETIFVNCAISAGRTFRNFGSSDPDPSRLPDIGLDYSTNIVFRYLSGSVSSDYSASLRHYHSSGLKVRSVAASDGYEFISKRNLALKSSMTLNKTYIFMEIRVGDYIIPAEYYRFKDRHSPEGLATSYRIIIFEGRNYISTENYTTVKSSTYPYMTEGIYPCDIYDLALGNLYSDSTIGDQTATTEIITVYNKSINGGTARDATISAIAYGTAACWTTPNGTINAPKYQSAPVTGEMPSKKTTSPYTTVTIFQDMIDRIYEVTWFDSKNWIGSANNFQHPSHSKDMECHIRIDCTGNFIVTPYARSAPMTYRHKYDGDGTPNKKCQQNYTFNASIDMTGIPPQVPILL